MPLSFSVAADSDLEHIYLTSVTMFGFEQAERYKDRLGRACELIAAHPKIARERTEFGTPVRAYRMQSHMIIYEIEADNDVFVLRFRHVREDWQSDPVNG